mgnify:CR=1 FL=1
MTLWIVFGLMCLAALVFVAWPLYRASKTLSPLLAGSVVVIVALSAGIYAYQGSPAIPSGAGATDASSVPDLNEMIAALAARLEAEPNDTNGWKMLGRSYMTLNNYAGAADAFRRAVELTSSGDAQALVGLGEAILARDNSRIEGETSALFESALALEPNNGTALFYGGIGALNRGNQELAADRWEILLGLNPPPEIQQVLAQRIAEWRGEPPPAMQQPAAERPGVVVTANVTVSATAAASLPAEATVFIIARDPGQPAPPIAAVRRRLSVWPDSVELGDGVSMIPGRTLSAFPEVELIARVSLSGQPVAQSGDWFGSQIV